MNVYKNNILNIERLKANLKQCKRQQQYCMGKAHDYWKKEEKRISEHIANFYGKSSRDEILQEASSSMLV